MIETWVAASAEISDCGRYRYRLTRRWAPGPWCTWVMLNPSTADATTDDATIRRCIGFAKRWGMSAIEVVNVWAWRATDPAELERAIKRRQRLPDAYVDPVGEPHNGLAITLATVGAEIVVAAWGNHAARIDANRAQTLTERLAFFAGADHGPRLSCLGRTQSGAPRHPVRLPYATEIEAFS